MPTLANVKLDNSNSLSNALTNELVIVPLSASTFPFAGVNSDGRNLDFLDADGVTSLAHSLRTWNTGCGIYLDSVLPAPAIDAGHAINSPICVVTGNLGLPNGPHTIWGVGTDINDPAPSYGVWNCYDKNNNIVWSFRSASQDYAMAADIGDLAGDGSDPVAAVGSRNQDYTGYLLNNNGTERWHYTTPGCYVRTAKIGKLTANAGNQVLFGGALGKLALLDRLGNQLWLNTYPDDGSGASMQGAVIADLSNTGTNYIYVSQGKTVRKISGAGGTIWTWNVGYTFDSTGYAIAAGHITSLTTKQLAVPATSPRGNNILGTVSVIDDTGTTVWQKTIPFGTYTLTVGDVNGDGYDEVIVQWNAAPEFTNNNGWGGLMILDRNGQELTAASMVGGAVFISYADWDGSGVKGVQVSSSFTSLYRYRFNTQGASVKATIPSIAADTIKTAFLASSANPTLLPPIGDFFFDLSGADGSAPPSMTQQVGAWTIQGNKIQSPSDGDTATIDALEFNGVSSDAFEFEFDFVKPDLGTGGATDYYAGVRYRCNSWSAGIPNCFLFMLGSKSHVFLYQYASGNSTPVLTLVNGNSGMTFTSTDVITVRLVVTGYDHSAQYRKNGGPWTKLYRALDTSASPFVSAGTFALYNNRGQTRDSNLKLWTIPGSFGIGPPGPAPLVSTISTPPPSVPSGSSAYCLLESGSHALLESGSGLTTESIVVSTTSFLVLESGSRLLMESGTSALMTESVGVPILPTSSFLLAHTSRPLIADSFLAAHISQGANS